MVNTVYCVYKHISPSGKVYIGITSQKPEYRWNHGKAYYNNKYFCNAINKYGWDNFNHIVIAKGLTKDEAKWIEIQLIDAYNSANREYGYNISLGGESGNGYIHTSEWKKQMSERIGGENHPLYGKHHTKEARQKISEANRGENGYWYGKCGKLSPNTKIVLCLTTGKSFWGIKEAGEYYDIKSHTHISACCIGKRKTCGGLRWIYLNGGILINFNHNKTYRFNHNKTYRKVG